MSATIPTGSLPAHAERVGTCFVSRAQGAATPRLKTASPWPWSAPPPVRLAPDEQMLWQGGPTFSSMAVRLYHIRAVAAYGVFLVMADIVQAKMQGLTLWPALEAAGPSVLTMAAGMAIFAALAWCSARTTRYTVTSHRVVMQCGLALPKKIGIPLHQVSAVAVRTRDDGTGDITLLPRPGTKLMYLKLWPFARPWHFRKPEPMLRDVPGAGYVASVLSRNVASVAEQAAAYERSV
ncbi:MAG: photosynthetic complex putative assembly protein PuhB [Janthinobacterium lividum]